MEVDRRTALTGGLAAGLASLPAAAAAQAAPVPGFTPRPLPFDAATVPGLSAKLLTSHHDNNYTGAVKRLGAIKAEFAKVDPLTAPGFTVNGLKREELIAWNSMILHEIYFAGLGSATAASSRTRPRFRAPAGTSNPPRRSAASPAAVRTIVHLSCRHHWTAASTVCSSATR